MMNMLQVTDNPIGNEDDHKWLSVFNEAVRSPCDGLMRISL